MERMAGRVAADRSDERSRRSIADRESPQTSYVHTKVSLLRSRSGMAIGSLVSRLGNSSSFVSQKSELDDTCHANNGSPCIEFVKP